MAGERVRVGALDPRDFGEDIVAEHRPVEPLLRHVPAEHRRIVQVLGEMRAVHEQLLRNAAADHAGSANPVFLCDGDARTVARGDARGPDSTGSGADDEQVELGHQSPALSISARVEASNSESSVDWSSLRAMSLPSSTPNWSKGLIPSSTAFAKVRCS